MRVYGGEYGAIDHTIALEQRLLPLTLTYEKKSIFFVTSSSDQLRADIAPLLLHDCLVDPV
jgi:hypothetical protein